MLRNALKFNKLAQMVPNVKIQEQKSKNPVMPPKNLVRPISFLKSV